MDCPELELPTCSTMSCCLEAVSTVPGYPDPLPKCFRCEREYVDRYGPAGVLPLGTANLDLGGVRA